MRKSTKLVVLVAALVALFSLTAFAATQKGWIAEDGKWYFYDNNGDKVSNTFKQDQGRWFYLGDDCAMVTSSLVDWNDNLYYVGEDGARVTNAWVKLAADSDDESGAEYRYYYAAGSDGKIFRATSETYTKKINGKTYAFDDDGKMLFGYVRDRQMINNEVDPILLCDHYFGAWNDGAMVTGWYEYKDGFVDYNAEKAWFYFASGVKVTENGAKLINKKYYAFDDNGVMQTGWYASGSEATKFYEASGALKKSGWVRTTTSEVTDDSWFYLSSGSAKTGAVLVSKKWYALKDNGAMVAGLVAMSGPLTNDGKCTVVATGLTGKTAAQLKDLGYTYLYYFSGDEANDGAAKTGSMKIDIADAEYTFAFDKHTYQALDGLDASSKMVYDTGMLQTPGAAYGVVSSGDDKFFVDSTGKVVTKNGKYGVDGKYYVVDIALAESNTNVVKYVVADADYFYAYMSGTTAKTKWVTSATVASDLLKVVNGKMTEAEFDAHYTQNKASSFLYK